MSQLTDKADTFVKSHWALTVLGAIFMTFSVALLFGVHSYEAKLGKANIAYAVLQAQTSAHDAEIKSHEDTRAQQAVVIRTIETQVQTRDTTSADVKAAVTAPQNTDDQVAKDSQTYLGVTPVVTLQGFAFQKQDVQSFIATKVDDTTAQQDNADLKTAVSTLKDEVSTSKTDLSTCEKDKDDTHKVLVDYKKAATKSKWRKTLDVTEKVGLLGAGIYIGSKVAK